MFHAGFAGLIAALVAACGSDGSGAIDAAPIDANRPDAVPCEATETRCGADCADLTQNNDHCGDCFEACTPARDCAASACGDCPAIVINPVAMVLFEMDDQMLAPQILGIGAYADGAIIQAVVVGFEDPGTLTAQDIDLAGIQMGDAPFVGLGFDVDTTSRDFRAVYRATAGTLNLSDRCATSVSGTITGAMLVEVDATVNPPTAIPGGCTAQIADLDFSWGQPCQ